jgi:hypothetical protein
MMAIDRRIIYLLLFLCLSIPLIRPIGLPLTVGKDTTAVHDYIDKLPAGSRIVISMDTSPGGWGEVMPGALALVNHLVEKGCKIFVMGYFDAGPSLFEAAVSSTALGKKTYGVDWVNLGYRAGGENGISAFAGDVIKTFPKDFRGNDTTKLEIMKDVKTAKDFALIITVSSGTPGTAEWVRQVRDPMGVPLASMVVAVNVPGLAPYVQSKQVLGLVAGLRGAAEYEQLRKSPGLGSAGMDAQSISHLLVLILVVLGNVGYLVSGRSKPKKGGR